MKTFEENIISRLQLLDREVERLRVGEMPIGGGVGETVTLTAGFGLTGGGDLSANRRFDVGAGNGITVGEDTVSVDLNYNFTWMGVHSFQNITYASSIMPHISDVYDLGSSASLWRNIWASELSAIVFAQYTQVLLGGWFTVSKGEGVLEAAVSTSATSILLDSSSVDIGDIIVFRGLSSTGNPQVEYMLITGKSGTTYSVTRNLDGSGANAWPAGSVYANYGTTGNGRIELNAYDTPRISVFSHADTIAGYREQVRIGDLINGWGYSTSTYGSAFGAYEYGKANITIDPTNGVRIRNYSQTIIQLTGTEASFENVIKLGTYGRLQQGTGTWGSNFTGSAIWNEAGVMNIGGWNNNVKQWWGGSDGKFYAGGGNVNISIDGITILTPDTWESGSSNNIKWKKDTLVPLEIGADYDEFGGIYCNIAATGTTNKKADLNIGSRAVNGIANVYLRADIGDTLLSGIYLSKSSSYRDIQLIADIISVEGGLHVGGTSDPGDNNLVVDGTIKDGSGVEYLKTNGKAADSDKLDGVDSTGFVNTTDAQTINGAKTFGTLPTLPTTTPTDNQAVRKGYADTAYLLNSGWKSYTPTWTAATTNPSIGNGTLSGRYIQIGKLVYCQFTMVAGSNTTFGSGAWRFSYPVSPNTSYIYLQVGSSLLADVGTRYYDGVTKYGGATFMTIIVGTGEIYATHPFTWTTNDSLTVNVIYEAA